MNQKLDLENAHKANAVSMSQPDLMPRVIRIGLPLVVIVAGLVVAWFMLTSTPTMERVAKPREARLVETVVVAADNRPVTLTAWGEVKAAQEVTLKAQVGGVVEALLNPLEPGSFVKKGEPLLQLERADYFADRAQKQAALDQARADLEIERGNQSVARSEFDLLGDDAGSAEKKLMLREPQLQSAKAAVQSAEAALAAAELNLQRTLVKAPFAGVIKERLVNVGSHVASNGDLLTLTGTDTAWVEVSVPLNQLRWIQFPDAEGKGGSVVTLHYDQVWSKDQSRTGKVIRLLSDLDSSGRMARVLVQVEDPLAVHLPREQQPPLLMGSFVRVEVQGKAIDDVVVIPSNLLHDNDTVWLFSGNQLVIRSVDVAYRDQDQAYIRSGIQPGDVLVSSTLSTATEGMLLRVKTEAGGAAR